jgi:hypothetical protein
VECDTSQGSVYPKIEEKEKDPLAQNLPMPEQLACGRKREWREDDGNGTREATSSKRK